MANYNNYSSGLGWKILSLFLALIIVAGVITGVVFWQRGNIVFTPIGEQQEGEQPEDNGGAVIEEGESHGMKLMSTRIAPENYAEYGISPMAETAYQLTATITPDNATNKAVNWSVDFANPSSSWATGKTVTDYVTVTPTSDGALTANVECLQDFGEQIVVTVTSRQNPDAYATCTVDFAQRIESLSFTAGDFSFDTDDDQITVDFSESREVSFQATWTDYTLSQDVSNITATYNVNESLLLQLDDAGIAYSEEKLDTPISLVGDFYLWGGSNFFSDYVDGRVPHDYSLLQISVSDINEAVEIAQSLVSQPMYTVTISHSTDYFTYEHTVEVYLSASTLTFSVDSIAMNESNLVF